ncbi:MAG: NAD-glutamate dehydrogenase domain-containing protein [Pseudomonadota bacterium]
MDADDAGRSAEMERLAAEIVEQLDAVSNADEDRILRSFLNLISATIRTNFYQKTQDGDWKSYLSLKFDSAKIDGLPKPRPYREIFVYSPRMEGVHLRGGKVARGGIRWSDRREDFRTEILGLVKAQMVKNAVIVPVGSKGGFVVKHPPKTGGREAFIAEGIECYKTLMRGMLDITDNRVQDAIIPPDDVVRHDEDDPYLVVAADKGTATFSDIANGVSQEYGFWLDDAFASGGSAGYDHKKMGITARGAWEAVKRHFREIGKDIQTTPFTAIGVGDMSGDVFGNGMLLSRQTKLLGAFNHMHIFIDPNPDPERTWEERKRLFDLPRSSWTDYDTNLISKGGAIFERNAKSLTLTTEIKSLFGIEKDKVTPNELLRAMLMSEIELLWFGGIGTYIKSESETNADAGDRANDAIRIDGTQLRCAVVGEGANLGMTQLGRIEFAMNSGRLNTDAVDNSAGVDCSDHEVNIKILLGSVVGSGDMTLKQRDALLEQMTDEVADLVLRDNYMQTLAISTAQHQGLRILDQQIRLMRQLERAGRLDRELEFLPDDEEIGERRAKRQYLTRPELSVLIAYAKLSLYDALLDSDFPDDPLLIQDLKRYFPTVLQEQFPDDILNHTLRREIIATFVTNSMINRAGTTFVSEMMEITGCAPPDIARAYAIVRDAVSLRPLWAEIESLDNRATAETQHALLFEVSRIISRLTVWFLRNGHHPLDITETLQAYGPGLQQLQQLIPEIMSTDNKSVVDQRLKQFRDAGVPEELTVKIAHLTQISAGCDIVRIGQQTGASVEAVGRVFYALGTAFGFDWLRKAASLLPTDNQWQDMAVTAIIEDLVANQVELTHRVITACGSSGDEMARPINGNRCDIPAIQTWSKGRETVVDRMKTMLAELRGAGTVDFAMLAVANRQLRILLAD